MRDFSPQVKPGDSFRLRQCTYTRVADDPVTGKARYARNNRPLHDEHGKQIGWTYESDPRLREKKAAVTADVTQYEIDS